MYPEYISSLMTSIRRNPNVSLLKVSNEKNTLFFSVFSLKISDVLAILIYQFLTVQNISRNIGFVIVFYYLKINGEKSA